MQRKYFALGFFLVSFLIIILLAFSYQWVAQHSSGNNILTLIWASLIFLFIIMGVIAISVFYSHVRDKKR
ncbi:hypothetical protein KW805_02075 [Candidatus Pacearchaeota archaeon]|nr:hypothetical protein [Candidatus Pacearchaeota archaeon]